MSDGDRCPAVGGAGRPRRAAHRVHRQRPGCLPGVRQESVHAQGSHQQHGPTTSPSPRTTTIGDSDPSKASGDARPDTAPDAPGAPDLTFGDRQITATWKAPASNGSPVTKYRIRISPAPEDRHATWSRPPTPLPCSRVWPTAPSTSSPWWPATIPGPTATRPPPATEIPATVPDVSGRPDGGRSPRRRRCRRQDHGVLDRGGRQRRRRHHLHGERGPTTAAAGGTVTVGPGQAHQHGDLAGGAGPRSTPPGLRQEQGRVVRGRRRPAR